MGVDLRARHLAQVSINLTDFEQTPLHRVFEMVKREAERYGVSIVGSEIVGLIPKRAIELTADFYLQLEDFSPAQVFENRIEASLGGNVAPEGPGTLAALAQPFLDAVAEPTATPGGGSVAALAGALGASLGQMVARLSRKKKSQAAYVDQLSDALAEFQTSSHALAEAIDRDAASFSQVMAAYKLPKDTSEREGQRDAAIQLALHGAASVPLEVARRAAEVFDRLGQLESISSPSMYSDIRVGRLMAAAAVRGALENVAINLESITDSEFATRLRAEATTLAARVAESPVAVGR
jgi:formiminotetrahydrofolate cyclodeaminase